MPLEVYGLAREWAQQLRPLVGLRREADVFRLRQVDDVVTHRGPGSSLNVTGTRAGESSLRSGWPTQSSGMRMRVRSG